MRNSLLLLATLLACRETATSRRRNGPEGARRYSLREDAVGCFKASFPRVGHEYPPRPYAFSHASVPADWLGNPGFRAAWPAAWDIDREGLTQRACSSD